MWFVLALLSAAFAAATSILAKVGIEGVNANPATAIRTAVVLVMAWGMLCDNMTANSPENRNLLCCSNQKQ